MLVQQVEYLAFFTGYPLIAFLAKGHIYLVIFADVLDIPFETFAFVQFTKYVVVEQQTEMFVIDNYLIADVCTPVNEEVYSFVYGHRQFIIIETVPELFGC